MPGSYVNCRKIATGCRLAWKSGELQRFLCFLKQRYWNPGVETSGDNGANPPCQEDDENTSDQQSAESSRPTRSFLDPKSSPPTLQALAAESPSVEEEPLESVEAEPGPKLVEWQSMISERPDASKSRLESDLPCPCTSGTGHAENMSFGEFFANPPTQPSPAA